MYAAEHGGPPTTGNTVGSEYPDATWKDLLKVAVLVEMDRNGYNYKAAIHTVLYGFNGSMFTRTMEHIYKYDEFEVNFNRLNTVDLGNIFIQDKRIEAMKEILCSKVEIEQLVDKEGLYADKVVIMDCSIKFMGDLVGWHYGVDFDKNSEDNQYYIQIYIDQMTK